MVLLYQFLLRYKDFFNQWKLYIISAVVLIMLLIGFIFWRQDEHTARDFENKDTALEQNTSENSSLSKLEDVQVKDGDNSKNKGPVYIDVKGAVKHPNVYKMTSKDRVIDLLDKAQLLDDADVSQINLSEKLTDQKMIFIPHKGQKNVEPQIGVNSVHTKNGNTKNGNTNNTKVNLNTASVSELMSVPGVGQAKANAIVEYRNQQGAFQEIDDLKKVKGFGSKTFDKLKSYFTT
ncbi:TPA: helix-hairpin-helix domain-containing protein [Staphylococcus argenteus]